MNYRTLGRTGLLVGEIGMGCEGFLEKSEEAVKQFIDLMEGAGANCIDLYSPNPDMRSALGKALAGRREKFVLQGHLCTVWKNGQYERSRDMADVKEGFEDLLKRLGTDYLDVGMIHYIDSVSEWESVKNGPVLEYALKLKEAGTIRAIGLSSHNPEASLAAVRTGLIDVLLFSINPCYDLQPANENLELLWDEKSYEKPLVNMEPLRQELYETCQRLGVGITVMKAFGGGDLLSEELSPAGKALTPYQCLHYALSRPGAACVMAGARSPEDLKQSLAYEDASGEEKDYARAFTSFPKISWKGHCMYCGHCAPCPQGIDVASVTKFLNLCRAQGEIPETVREHYAVLSHTASECIRCGSCETRCPFQVPVMKNMEEAAGLFGK